MSSPDRSPVLLPGLDLLNHNPTAKVIWQWTEETCCISTDVALASGEEIFNNYAPKSNEERKDFYTRRFDRRVRLTGLDSNPRLRLWLVQKLL